MSHFFAFLSKLKYINRWGVMRNSYYENDLEHTMMVTFVTHGLCEVAKNIYNQSVNTELALKIAMYHEASELITGDLPTPIKYANKEIFTSFKEIEKKATDTVFNMLPGELMDSFEFMKDETDSFEKSLVKSADKICAYIKCIDEIKVGNMEFVLAKKKIEESINKIEIPAVKYWMDNFIESFSLTIDELN